MTNDDRKTLRFRWLPVAGLAWSEIRIGHAISALADEAFVWRSAAMHLADLC
ncbi:hypothetical protein LJR098_002621 [Rhizobium sp. LjRoot98]|uniref:hypothetical protein n=1 Tax=Rhizobium sp. LjRoot98 TaxID=3342345 RepID=UPI003ECF71B2